MTIEEKALPQKYYTQKRFALESSFAIILSLPVVFCRVWCSSRFDQLLFLETDSNWQPFHSVLTLLSYLSKAPIVPPGTPVVNALFKQRQCIENVFRACLGLPPVNNMMLEYKLSSAVKYTQNPVTSATCMNSPNTHKISPSKVASIAITNGHSNTLHSEDVAQLHTANGYH